MAPDAVDQRVFECVACGHRVTELPSRICPTCGGEMKNLSVARE